MEDVLDVYTRPVDPNRPLVCLDETSKQLVGEIRLPIPISPGQVARYDAEYVRNGVSSLFLLYAPLEAQEGEDQGWRQVVVTDRRTRVDYAHVIRDLVDLRYPEANKIVLVQDQLNTHSIASLYEAFEPKEAKRLADKLEIHYTPKHGSWLNMAEIELSILGRQCLDRRIPDKATLVREVQAWQERRNRLGARIDWRFTTADARIKLKHLYPSTIE
jgi:hypothetical protein